MCFICETVENVAGPKQKEIPRNKKESPENRELNRFALVSQINELEADKILIAALYCN